MFAIILRVNMTLFHYTNDIHVTRLLFDLLHGPSKTCPKYHGYTKIPW